MLYARSKYPSIATLLYPFFYMNDRMAAKTSLKVSVRPAWYCSGDNRKGILRTIKKKEKIENQLQLAYYKPAVADNS